MTDAWTVVVTTEPEWDAHTAGQAEGIALHDEDCCPGCGLHESVLSDPERNRFEFDERYCKVCAAQALKQRLLAEADEDWEERHKDAKPRERRPSDGRHVRLRQLSPLEVLARQVQDL